MRETRGNQATDGRRRICCRVIRDDLDIWNPASLTNSIMLFGGFNKCLYPVQKFDSDPERRFAMILESEPAVEKWLRPAKGQFKIDYRLNHNDQSYEPECCCVSPNAPQR